MASRRPSRPLEHDPREACAEIGVGTPCEVAVGAIGGAPCGARSASGVCRNMRRDAMRPLLLRPSAELPMERDPGEGWAEMGGGTPRDLLSGAVGGAPCGARSVSGVYGRSGAMRTLSLGLSVELPEAISLRGEEKYAGGLYANPPNGAVRGTLCEARSV